MAVINSELNTGSIDIKDDSSKRIFLRGSLGSLAIGAVTEIYATASIMAESLPGDTKMLVGAGVLSLLGGIGLSFGAMPQAVEISSGSSTGD
jgi:hypothetical protein